MKRWEHEDVLDAMQKRLDQVPQAMALRRQTAEHPFWVGTEMSLQVLAYNMKRVLAIIAPMGLDDPDDHVGAFTPLDLAGGQHFIGLADAGRSAEKDFQPPPFALLRRAQERVGGRPFVVAL